jgi:peptidoglycan hydrolase-like protein with peptidoglycan-binding domain
MIHQRPEQSRRRRRLGRPDFETPREVLVISFGTLYHRSDRIVALFDAPNVFLDGMRLAAIKEKAGVLYRPKFFKEAKMKKSCVATLSGLALGAAVIVSVPYAWSQAGQAGSGAAPSSGQEKGSESQVQKPTDPPMDSGPRSGSTQSGKSRGESTGMQSGTESRTAGGHQWSKDKVKEVQEALKGNGFDPGTADGVIGPKTNQAIRDFQKSKNLQATGRIDERTASALGVDTMSKTGGRSSSTSPSGKDKSGDEVGSEPTKPGARGGSTIDPPSKPTGKD